MDASTTNATTTASEASGISRTAGLLYLLAGTGATIVALVLLFALLSRVARSVGDSSHAPRLVRAARLAAWALFVSATLAGYVWLDGVEAPRHSAPLANVMRFAAFALLALFTNAKLVFDGSVRVRTMLVAWTVVASLYSWSQVDFAAEGELDTTHAAAASVAAAASPVALRPTNACAKFEASRYCAALDWSVPNPDLWGRFEHLNLTLTQQRSLVDAAMDVLQSAVDMASEKDAAYDPVSLGAKRACLMTVIETFCSFAFVRCTGDCTPLPPCLAVCESMCPDLKALFELLEPLFTTPDAAYRVAATASAQMELGDCVDLPMQDGAAWRSGDSGFAQRWVDFDLSPDCLLPAISVSNSDKAECDAANLGTDGATSMTEACCLCGGGAPKAAPAFTGRLQDGGSAGLLTMETLQGVVDSVINLMATSCGEQAPAGTLLLKGSCLVRKTKTGNELSSMWWAADNTTRLEPGDGDGVHVVYQTLSLKVCALRCGVMLGCTAFTVSEKLGCAFWLDGRCSADGAQGMLVGPQSIPTFRMCSAASPCPVPNTTDADAGDALALRVAAPCSSRDASDAVVMLDEASAACRDEYLPQTFAEELRRHEEAEARRQRASALYRAEHARVDAAQERAWLHRSLAVAAVVVAQPLALAVWRLYRGAPQAPPLAEDGFVAPTISTLWLLGVEGFSLVLARLFNALLMYNCGVVPGAAGTGTDAISAVFLALCVVCVLATCASTYRSSDIAARAIARRHRELAGLPVAPNVPPRPPPLPSATPRVSLAALRHMGRILIWRYKVARATTKVGGKYFVHWILLTEVSEVLIRVLSLIARGGTQDTKITELVANAVGVNFVVTPALLLLGKPFLLLIFDVVIDQLYLSVDLYTRYFSADDVVGWQEPLATTVACLALLKTFGELNRLIIEANALRLAEAQGAFDYEDAAAAGQQQPAQRRSTTALIVMDTVRKEARRSLAALMSAPLLSARVVQAPNAGAIVGEASAGDNPSLRARLRATPRVLIVVYAAFVASGCAMFGYFGSVAQRMSHECETRVGAEIFAAMPTHVYFPAESSVLGEPTCRFDLVESLDLGGLGLGDAELAKLSEFARLRELVLSGNDASDLRPLLKMQDLENVDLGGTPAAANVTLEGAGLTSPLPAWLRRAVEGSVEHARLRGNNLTAVPRWLSRATTLDVRANPIAPNGLPVEVVSSVPTLRIEGTPVASHLDWSGIESLDELSFPLDRLRAWPTLARLNVSGCSFGPRYGVNVVVGTFARLMELDIRGNNVTGVTLRTWRAGLAVYADEDCLAHVVGGDVLPFARSSLTESGFVGLLASQRRLRSVELLGLGLEGEVPRAIWEVCQRAACSLIGNPALRLTDLGLREDDGRIVDLSWIELNESAVASAAAATRGVQTVLLFEGSAEWFACGATASGRRCCAIWAEVEGMNMSLVTSMRDMFVGASSFNADLSHWDVAQVTTMRYMFLGASSFNGDLSRWDVSKVVDMMLVLQ